MRIVREQPRSLYGTVLLHVLVVEDEPEMATSNWRILSRSSSARFRSVISTVIPTYSPTS